MMVRMTLAYLFLLSGLLSAATLAVYAWDKAMAVRARRRIPEYHLHLLAVFGGWLGALLAQRWLRHKNRKAGFQLVFWLSALLNLSAWVGYYWLAS